MLQSLPMDDLGEMIQEDHLKSSYILPVLKSLFDDLDDTNLVLFKLNNQNNYECKNETYDISQRRPDGIFRYQETAGNLISIGFMEAKPESSAKSSNAIMIDLVRLGFSGKNAIDNSQNQKLSSCTCYWYRFM